MNNMAVALCAFDLSDEPLGITDYNSCSWCGNCVGHFNILRLDLSVGLRFCHDNFALLKSASMSGEHKLGTVVVAAQGVRLQRP